MTSLKIQRPDGSAEVVELRDETIRIGKVATAAGLENQLILDDETVSRSHAQILYQNGSYYIEDLDSSNHTFVNDQRIQRAHLQHRDLIRIGLNLLTFESDESRVENPTVLNLHHDGTDVEHTVEINYSVLRQISEEMNHMSDINSFCEWAIQLICHILKADKGVIVLLGSDAVPYFKARHGVEMFYSQGLLDQAMETQILTRKTHLDDSDTATIIRLRQIESVLCVPLLHQGNLRGVVGVEDRQPDKFGEREARLLTSIANQIAVGLEGDLLQVRIREMQVARSSLEDFVQAIQESAVTQRAILDANPDLLLQMDRKGRVLHCKMPVQHFPFLPDDPLGSNIADFLPEKVVAVVLPGETEQLRDADEALVSEFSFVDGERERFFENRVSVCGGGQLLLMVRDLTARVEADREKERLISELQEALTRIKTLRGLIPMCSACKKIRDDQGYWNQLELYIQEHSEAAFSHSMCPECMEEWYGDYAPKKKSPPELPAEDADTI